MFFPLFSCIGNEEKIVLWKCENSVLYLNAMDTCFKAPGALSDYDLYLSIRHHEDFRRRALRFGLEISSSDTTIKDTVLIPLADSAGYWEGTPYIGAYVRKVHLKTNLPAVDSAEFSLMPLMSDAIEGVDWLALELIKNEQR